MLETNQPLVNVLQKLASMQPDAPTRCRALTFGQGPAFGFNNSYRPSS